MLRSVFKHKQQASGLSNHREYVGMHSPLVSPRFSRWTTCSIGNASTHCEFLGLAPPSATRLPRDTFVDSVKGSGISVCRTLCFHHPKHYSCRTKQKLTTPCRVYSSKQVVGGGSYRYPIVGISPVVPVCDCIAQE